MGILVICRFTTCLYRHKNSIKPHSNSGFFTEDKTGLAAMQSGFFIVLAQKEITLWNYTWLIVGILLGIVA
jgi:hypothetical protein